MLREVAAGLTPEELDNLRELLNAAATPEALLDMLAGLAAHTEFKHKPVDMKTFLMHPDYLGQEGKLWPVLADDLIELFDGEFHEAVCCGGIGWGKSTFAALAEIRMLYEVSCLRNPQAAFGLMDGSTIALLNASVNKIQARRVVFESVKELASRSPYFRESFPFDPEHTLELRFPNNVLITAAAGSEGGTVGYNVFGAVLDEVNFWNVVERSNLARGQKYDQARSVHDLLLRRMKSRFNKAGKLPGLLLSVSSSKYPDDFTERRIEEALIEDDGKTFIRRYANWETRPAEKFMSSRFYLYLGNSSDRPAISKDVRDFEDKDVKLVLDVPMDFYADFQTDLDGSIRDIAGHPTLAILPYLPDRAKIFDAVERGRARKMEHPMTQEVTTLVDGAALLASRLTPQAHTRYFAHVDLALTKDAAGLAIGHVTEYREVIRQLLGADGQSVLTRVQLPIIAIDLMLRVEAPEGGEIQIDAIRGLLLEARAYGLHFAKITFDQYQSASSIQAFNQMGIPSEKLSVDGSMEPYESLKEALAEDRLMLYEYAPFISEAVRLEIKPGVSGKRTKVDHPPKGSKDVCDAVAGVVFHCSQAAPVHAVGPIKGELMTGVESEWAHLSDEQRSKLSIRDVMFRDFDRAVGDSPGDGFIGFA